METTLEVQRPAAAASGRPKKNRNRQRRPRSAKLIAGLSIAGAIALFGILGPMLLGDPNAISNETLAAPGNGMLLGTTQTGQDVLAQLAHATRGSLTIGVLVGAMAIAASAFFGIVGAYIGGWTDEAFSLITNVMLVIPGLPLVIVISSYVPDKGLFLIAGVLALTSWAGGARVLRAVTLSLRNRDYVAASRVSGEKTWRILLVEILPNLMPILASQMVFAVIFAILGEAGLAFIGLGASGTWTWGSMLFYAQNGLALRLGAWWWFVPPGLLIAVFGAALSLINFSIDEIINPKLRDQTLAARKRWNKPRAGKTASAGTGKATP
ncbi:peptide/nickel transport system permease protein [Arthrobacter alpinus]|uniref:Peptide/nickel transport system permease protein n=1 Tax=Arthrobacter alpinus TaxID=656366 RepID=A0A1H5LBW4_9MICC|nr:ABC transporter permease [Arthrobacter alpinus]SEE74490.1 peptide/nickel transport system permease protein [Arthrobacter alpinus]